MKDHSGCIRAFYRLSHTKFKYSISQDDHYKHYKIMIGMFDAEDHSTTGEFCIEWENLGGVELSPRLKAFNDSWSALLLFKDVLEKMAEIDGQNIQEPEFCKILESLRIKDITDNI